EVVRSCGTQSEDIGAGGVGSHRTNVDETLTRSLDLDAVLGLVGGVVDPGEPDLGGAERRCGQAGWSRRQRRAAAPSSTSAATRSEIAAGEQIRRRADR